MTETVIEIKNLSKAYSIYKNPKDLFLEVVTKKSYHDLFWALRDVSFSVKSGQRLGIIGPNGSGKSTLLQIIAGNLNATSGAVTVNTEVSALLSLVPSWNTEETGLENIRFNLLLRGCNNKTIESKLEEIIDFAELGQFIHQPVKTYSAGMSARLSFAIATAIVPEILIVDEVLGAGDGYFAGKAVRRMKELCSNGKALLFVSHSIAAVQMMCDTVLWLDNGLVRMIGPAEEVLRMYEEDYRVNDEILSRKTSSREISDAQAQVTKSDYEALDYHRLRVVAVGGQKVFKDTHYVRRIAFSSDSVSFENNEIVSIDDVENENPICRIDRIKSEWGRYIEREGIGCLTLSSRTGKSKGGHILFKQIAQSKSKYKKYLILEAKSHLGNENLSIELLNYRTGKWEAVNRLTRKKIKDGWEQIVAEFDIELVSKDIIENRLAEITDSTRRPLEILEISVLQELQSVALISENTPFEIKVKFRANKLVDKFDVIINVYRSDGVYVFWQSSGMNGENYSNLIGEYETVFSFVENFFGPGDYMVGASIANGYDLKNNFPYSEIFDLKVNVARFSILREFGFFSVGIINKQVPVVTSKL